MKSSSQIYSRSAKSAVAPLLGFALCLTGFGLASHPASALTKTTEISSGDLKAENRVPGVTNPNYRPLQPGYSYVTDTRHFNDDGVKRDYQKFVVALKQSDDAKIKAIAVKVVPGKAVNIAVKKRLGADRYVVGVVSENDGGAEVDVIIHMETHKVIAIDKHKVLAVD